MILTKRPPLPYWAQILIPFIAIVVSLCLSSIPIIYAKGDLFKSYFYLFYGALGTRYNFLETCVKSSPLIFTGLAVAFAFRAKFWNIGAEGQLLAGAIVAAWIGINIPEMPKFVAIALIVGAGFVAGGLWALIPALLKTKLKVDDVVSSLLLNYVMWHIMGTLLFGPLQQPGSSWPRSPSISELAKYPILLARSRFHLGIVMAVVAIAIIWFINEKTVLGYRIKSVGANLKAADFGGIPTTSVIIKTAMISGGLAALAGVGEVCAIHYHLLMDVSPGYGYSGIIIAMLGRLHPLGVGLSAFFFSMIIVGAQTMSRMTGVPVYIADVIQGMALLIMLIAQLFTEYKIKVISK